MRQTEAAIDRRQQVDAMARAGAEAISARALLLGDRLDTRALETGDALATAPLAMALQDGVAVLFRYGVVVMFGTTPEATDRFVAGLAGFVTEPLAAPEREEAQLIIRPGAEQQIDAAGNIVLPERSVERLQLVADVLAKNLVLAHYETRVATIFDRVEPLAARLRRQGRPGADTRELLHNIGYVLAMQHKVVGRVETREKPELLWEHPELERLYMRLAEEYELRDRDRALDRKLDVISRTAETLLGLVQARSSIRVEWYIVVLIVAELLVGLYSLLPGR